MSQDVTWCHVVSHGVTWCHVVSHGVTSCHVVSHGVTWCHVLSRCVMWHYMSRDISFRILRHLSRIQPHWCYRTERKLWTTEVRLEKGYRKTWAIIGRRQLLTAIEKCQGYEADRGGKKALKKSLRMWQIEENGEW